MSLSKVLITLFTGLIGLCALGIYVLLFLLVTESGSRAVINYAISSLNEKQAYTISAEKVNGTIYSGMSFTDLSLEIQGTSQIQVHVNQIDFEWRLSSLFKKHVQLNSLIIEAVEISVSGDDASSENIDIQSLISPLFEQKYSFTLDRGSVAQLELIINEQLSTIENIYVELSVVEDIQLPALNVTINETLIESQNWQLNELASINGDIHWSRSIEDVLYEGQLALGGKLNALQIDHIFLSPVAINTTGEFRPDYNNPASHTFSFEHSIINLDLLTGSSEFLQSVSGNFSTAGTIDNFEFSGESSVVLDEVSEFNVNIEGQYEDKSVIGTWSLPDFNYERPNELNIENLSAAGDFFIEVDQQISGELNLENLIAEVNGHPLSAIGSVNLSDNSVDEFTIEISQLNNAFVVDGSIDLPESIVDADFILNIPNTSMLYPSLDGNLTAQGVVSGSLTDPNIQFQASGEELNLVESGVSLGQIALEYGQQGSQLTLSAKMENLVTGGNLHIETGEISAHGAISSHEYLLDLVSNHGGITATGQGQWDNGLWQTIVSLASIESDYGNWQLESLLNEIQFSVPDKKINFEELCWLSQSLELCALGDVDLQGSKQISATLQNVPLSWLNFNEKSIPNSTKPVGLAKVQDSYNVYLPQRTIIDGNLNLSASLTQESLESPVQFVLTSDSGQFSVTLQDLSQLRALTARTYDVRYEPIVISSVDDNWSVNSTLDISETTSNGIPLISTIGGLVALDRDKQLTGEININLPSVSWLETFIPVLENPLGQLDGSLGLSGSLQQPVINSDLQYTNGSVELPEYGLELREIELNVQSDENEGLEIVGKGNSGEGNLTIDALIESPFESDRVASINITGADFTVIDLENRKATISPQLNLLVTDELVNIEGEVTIPTLALSLENELSLANKVSESSDVIIVDPENLPEESSLVGQARNIPIQGAVNLVLGEEVKFNGYGLDVELGGQISLEQRAKRPIISYGELRVLQGTYTLYEQTLSSQDGQLLFLGNPANPVLDIRTTREVRDTTVGMHLSGTLNNISGLLFSSPSLPESEILALLITGKSFTNTNNADNNTMLAAVANLGLEKGQGLNNTIQNKLGLDTLSVSAGSNITDSSVGIGKYLSPSLYVQYEVGLFDKETVLSLDYYFNENFKLEVESGISQSIGLTYTREK